MAALHLTRRYSASSGENKKPVSDSSECQSTMQDLLNTFLLICAAIASLSLGVLLAYAVCKAAFAMLRMHAQTLRPALAPVKVEAIRAS